MILIPSSIAHRCILNETMCEASHAQVLVKLQPIVAEHFNLLGGILFSSFVILLIMVKVSHGCLMFRVTRFWVNIGSV